jgi:hypothetical protein
MGIDWQMIGLQFWENSRRVHGSVLEPNVNGLGPKEDDLRIGELRPDLHEDYLILPIFPGF